MSSSESNLQRPSTKADGQAIKTFLSESKPVSKKADKREDPALLSGVALVAMGAAGAAMASNSTSSSMTAKEATGLTADDLLQGSIKGQVVEQLQAGADTELSTLVQDLAQQAALLADGIDAPLAQGAPDSTNYALEVAAIADVQLAAANGVEVAGLTSGLELIADARVGDAILMAQADVPAAPVGAEAAAGAGANVGAGAAVSAAGAATASVGMVGLAVAGIGLAVASLGSSSGTTGTVAATDTTAPAAPAVTLTTDSGASGADKITSSGTVSLSGVEAGATVQYSTDGGTNWVSSFTAVEGANSVQVRQTDAAGNISAASAALVFTLDTSAPVVISLAATSGTNTIVLTYDGALDATNLPAPGAYQVTTGGSANVVTGVAVSGSQVTLTLTRNVELGSVSVQYADPSAGNDANAIQDAAGNDAVGFIQGTVADGYVRGAQIFIDTNGNGTADASEALVGVLTDAQGNFFLPSTAPRGTIIAVGGVNIDTGVPNTVPLKAPEGATTVNPLTTLVQEVIETAAATGTTVTAEQAAADVAAVLGLDLSTTGQSLLTFDPLAAAKADPTSAVALATQKAAAQIATIIAVAADSGAAGDAAAVTQNLANLIVTAAAAPSPTTVNLSDSSTIADALAGSAVSVNDVTELQTAVVAISTSTSVTDISAAQSAVLDNTRPTAATSSVTAAVTNDNTPAVKVMLDVVSLSGGAVVVGDTVQLKEGVTDIGAAVTLSATDISNGFVTINTSVLLDGSHNLYALVTDQAGNTSTAGTSATISIDTVAPTTPTVSLTSDTGSSNGDAITNSAALTLGAAESGASRSYKIDDGAASNSYTAPTADGQHTVLVTDTDAAGNTSSASITFTLDKTIAAPTLALTADTGSSPSDNITNNAALSPSAAAGDVTRTYTVDGGAASATYVAPTTDGAHTVVVNDVDTAGNTSSASITFTLDKTVSAPVVALAGDTGSSTNDLKTSNGLLAVTGQEAGALVEYSVDNGTSWTSTFSAASGSNTVQVRQTDVAGNVSAASELTFTLDTTAPAATALAPADGGESLGLAANLVLTASEAIVKGASGSVTLYKADGTLVETLSVTGSGVSVSDNQLIINPAADLVKDQQYYVKVDAGAFTDLAGNAFAGITDAGTWNFTAAGASVSIGAVAGNNVVNAQEAGVVNTVSGTISADPAILLALSTSDLQVALRPAAGGNDVALGNIAYSYTSGTSATWSADISAGTLTGVADYSIVVTLAGSVAGAAVTGSATLPIQVDTDVAAPTVSLTADTGKLNSDGLTNNGALTLSGVETGATVQYSTDGGTNWVSSFTAVEGANSVQVRQTDAAGNTSVASTAFAFAVDATAPTTPEIISITDNSGNASDRLTNDTTPVIVVKAESGTLIKAGQNNVEISTAYSVSEATNGDGTSNYTVTFSEALADGGFGFVAIDAAGNKSASAAAGTDGPNKFKIDATAPTTPEIISITDNSGNASDRLTNDTTPVIVVKAESGTLIKAGQNGVEIGTAYSVSEATNGDGTSNYTVTFSEALADGGFGFVSIDAAGNKSASAAAGTDGPNKFKIDATAPTTPEILSITDNGGNASDRLTNDTTPVIVVKADSGTLIKAGQNGVEIATAYSVSEATNGDGTSNYTVTFTGALADGGYGFAAIDAAGNKSASAAAGTDGPNKFKIDATAPALVVHDGDNLAFQFNFGEAVTGFDASDVVATNGVVDTASLVDLGGGKYSVVVTPSSSTTPVDFAINVAAGAAQDAAGNASTAGSFAHSVMFGTTGNDVLTNSGVQQTYIDISNGGNDTIKIAVVGASTSAATDEIAGFDVGDKIDLSAILGVGGAGYTSVAQVDTGAGFVELKNVTLVQNAVASTTTVKFDVHFDAASIAGAKVEGAVLDLDYDFSLIKNSQTATATYLDPDFGNTVNVWSNIVSNLNQGGTGKIALTADQITLSTNPIITDTGKTLSVTLILNGLHSTFDIALQSVALGGETSIVTSTGPVNVDVGVTKTASLIPSGIVGSSNTLEVVIDTGSTLGTVTDNQLHFLAVYDAVDNVTHTTIQFDTNSAAGTTVLSDILALDFSGDMTGKLTPDSFIPL